MTDEETDRLLRQYIEENPLNATAIEAMARWEAQALAHQKIPDGDWLCWLLNAGRGAGKTRVGAQTSFKWTWLTPESRLLVAAPTYGDLIGVCFEGESGLLNVIPHELIEPTSSGTLYNRSDVELRLKNGSLIKGISAEKPDRFRGHQFHFAWLDELSSWQRDKEAWDLLQFCLRLGTHPRIVATTTPKPRLLIRDLMKREGKDVVVSRASTHDNLKNLAPSFANAILAYEGTALGQQEIYAQLIDPSENGIIKASWIRQWPADKPLPAFKYVVMSLDTAYTEKTHDKKTFDRDPTACTVWGLFLDQRQPKFLLLDCWTDHLGLPDLIRRVKKEMDTTYGTAEKPKIAPLFGPKTLPNTGRKPDLVLIEDIGSGKSLRQMLAAEGIETYAYNPHRAAKVDRLHAVSPIFAQGMVYIPESQKRPGEFISWASELIEQLTLFVGEGSLPHDDLVDSTTQAIRVMMDMKHISVTAPKPIIDPDERERDYSARRSSNPYAA